MKLLSIKKALNLPLVVASCAVSRECWVAYDINHREECYRAHYWLSDEWRSKESQLIIHLNVFPKQRPCEGGQGRPPDSIVLLKYYMKTS